MDTNKKSNKENRDPITGEPGSHPVGTALGATALGAAGAGAMAGAAAGPIGVGVGAAAGAIIGGVAGHAAGEHFDPTNAADMGRYIDYKVVDSANDKIGTVDAVWEDHTGQPSYLAIRTGWLGLGKTHVVPAHTAEVQEERRKIRLPYSADMVKAAPTFESADEIDQDAEVRIRTYFAGTGTTPSTEEYNQSHVDQPATRSTPVTADEDTNLRLKAEEVKIGKREVEYGGVRLRKIVRTEVVNQPVELQREEIIVERVPVSGESTTTQAGDDSFTDQEIFIPLRREEAVVEKSVRTTEEIHVGKRRETERRDISETVRREDVEVEKEGDANLDDDGGTTRSRRSV